MIDYIEFSIPATDAELTKAMNHVKMGRCVYDEETLSIDNRKNKIKIGGFFISFKKNRIYFSGSIHKFYNAVFHNKLNDNYSNNITFGDALRCVKKIEQIIDIPLEDATIHKIEYGLNIYDMNPDSVIANIEAIGKRQFFADAYYPLNKQKTTIRTTNTRVFYKIYNKTFEVYKRQKKVIPNCLRIETIEKRPYSNEVPKTLNDVFNTTAKFLKDFKKKWSATIFRQDFFNTTIKKNLLDFLFDYFVLYNPNTSIKTMQKCLTTQSFKTFNKHLKISAKKKIYTKNNLQIQFPKKIKNNMMILQIQDIIRIRCLNKIKKIIKSKIKGILVENNIAI